MKSFITKLVTFWVFSVGIVHSQNACLGTNLIETLSSSDNAKLAERVSETPFARGLLWKATRDDLVLNIFGTYHLLHRQTEAHLAYLTPLIEAADQVFLEMSPDDIDKLQADLVADPSLMFIISGPSLPDLLGKDDWERYENEMQARQFPGFMAARFKPSWASMMLGISPCEIRSGALDGNGIDEQIGAYAEKTGIPVQSVEDYRTVMKLFDDMSEAEQVNMIRMFLDWPGNADDLAYTLRETYLAGHLGRIWAYSEIQAENDGLKVELAEFEDRLLTRRNQGWVKMIDKQADGQMIFMAVGAAHLPGEYGILNLLQEMGFSVSPLPFEPEVK